MVDFALAHRALSIFDIIDCQYAQLGLLIIDIERMLTR